MEAIGKISLLIGTVYAKDSAGNQRILSLGDSIFEGEVIVASAGSEIKINMINGESITVADGQQWTPTSETFTISQDTPTSDQVIGGSDFASVQSIQQALLSGADPSQFTEATAAGGAPGAGSFGGAGEGGNGFVSIARLGAEVDPNAGYETIATQANIVAPVADPQLFVAQAASDPTVTSVTVANADINGGAVVEGNDLVFTITLSTFPSNALVLPFTIGVGGTASPSDYSQVSFSDDIIVDFVNGTITIPEGVNTFTATLPTIDDTDVELTERVPFSVGGVSVDGIIIDNDSPKVSSIDLNASGDEVVEGNDLIFTVTLDAQTTAPVQFSFSLGGGTAAATDYSQLQFSNNVVNNGDGTITVPIGVTSFTSTLPTVDDQLVEQTETVTLNVGGIDSQGSILDNDQPKISSIALADDEVVEGNPLTFTVTLSEATISEAQYPLTLGNGTASNTDYGSLTFNNGVSVDNNGVLKVPAGVSSFTATLPTVDDELVEQTETVILNIDGVNATGNILDNDQPSIDSISLSPDEVVEGTNLVFTITLSEATINSAQYPLTLSNGSASNADYGALTFSNNVVFSNGIITVPTGVTSFTATLPTVDDQLIESTETVLLSVDGVEATGSILDNDQPSINSIALTEDQVVEGNPLEFTVTLSEATISQAKYPLTLGNGTASNTDYGLLTFTAGVTVDNNGVLTVPAGVTSFIATLPTVDDSIVETTETVLLNIDGVSGTGSILDNDKPSIDSINFDLGNDQVVEGNSLVFKVSLSEATQSEVSYTFTLGNGSASNIDYGSLLFSHNIVNNNGVISVPAGVTNFTATLPTIDDSLIESTETVILTIENKATTGSILDNDRPSITDVNLNNSGDQVVEGNPLIFTVSLSTATVTETKYPLSLVNGTASNNDYTALTFSNNVVNDGNGFITVPAGVSSFTINLPTVDDDLVELTETVTLSVDGESAIGSIKDNDKPDITEIEPGASGLDGDSVVEGNDLVFNVTLSESTIAPTTYDFNLGGGTASIADYTNLSFSNDVINNNDGTITVPKDVSSFSVTLPTVDDLAIESTETVPITIGGVTASGNILDNDQPSIIEIEPGQLGIGGDAVTEGQNLVFNVTLSSAPIKAASYDLNLQNGTASNADYTNLVFSKGVVNNGDGTITVPVGVSKFTASLPTIDDAIVESTESVSISIGGLSATGEILDNDQPTITQVELGDPGVDGNSVIEGNSLIYNVTLSEAPTRPALYGFSLGGGTATVADYTFLTFNNGVINNGDGTITVPVGVTNFSATLPTVDDIDIETTEAVPFTVGDKTATGTILDNDQPTIIEVEPGQLGVEGDAVVEGTNLVFNVALSGAPATDISFDLALGGGTAAAGDYTNLAFSNGVTLNGNNSVTVPAGITNFTVTLPTVDDLEIEATETIPLTIGGVTGTGQILDNDQPSIIAVEPGQTGIDDDAVVEGNNLVFNVSLDGSPVTPVTYNLSLGGDTASIDDYSNLIFSNGVVNNGDNTITVPAGITAFTVTLPTIDDSEVELAESVPLTIGGVSGTGIITDNDKPNIESVEPGQIGVADNSVVEGNNLVFNVTLSAAPIEPIAYILNLGGNSASAADYTNLSFSDGVTLNNNGSITVPIGVTSFTVTLPTVDDIEVESTEAVPLTIGGVTGTGLILDNDQPVIKTVEPGEPGVAGDAVVEGNSLVFNISLSEAPVTPALFNLNLGGDSASLADYTNLSFSNGVTNNGNGTITVPTGVTSFTATLPTVDDIELEATEKVPLTIGGVTGIGSIIDNDQPSIIEIEPGRLGVEGDHVVEGNNLVFNVALSAAPVVPVTYNISLGGGSASSTDYTDMVFSNGVVMHDAGSITVPAGVTKFTVTLPTVDDSDIESTETVPLTIGGITGQGHILDNEQPTITTIEPGDSGIEDDSVVEGNNLVFNVSLSGAPVSPATFDFTLGNGSATTDDYTNLIFSNGVTNNGNGTITVPTGVTSFSATLPTVDDTTIESTETVPITIGGVSATGSILDNDQPTISGVTPSIDGETVIEGNDIVFNVTLSSAPLTPASYNLNLGGGTASVADYTNLSFSNGVTLNGNTITVPTGVTNFTATLPTVDDSDIEQTEAVPLTIGGVTGTGLILDNDQPTIDKVEPGKPGIEGDSVVEGTDLVFNVSLSEETISPATFNLTFGGNSASAADYTNLSFSDGVTINGDIITVPAGVSNFVVTLPTVDDATVELTEAVPLTIGGVTGTGLILDNDQPTISKVESGEPGIGGDSVTEGENLVFNVTLSDTPNVPATYNLSLGGGSASAIDYTNLTFSDGVVNNNDGTITVPANVSSFSITLPTVDDAKVESTESVPLTIGGVTGTGLILDNDQPSIIEIEPGQLGIGGDSVVEGIDLVFNVTLSEAPIIPARFNLSIGNGTASAADYTNLSFSNGVILNNDGSITVPVGVTKFSVTLPTVDDVEVEVTESVPLTIGGLTGTGLILDNDQPTISTIEPGAAGIGGDSVTEGTNLVFNVTLTQAPVTPALFTLNLGGGSASLADYTNLSFNNGVINNGNGTITVPVGVSTFAATLPTVDDVEIETTEAVPISIGGVSATGLILDNDQPTIIEIEPGQLGVQGDSVVEGNDLVFNISLSAAPVTPAIYNISLGGDSASAADYTNLTFSNGVTNNGNGTITVPVGVTKFSAILPTVDDALVESTETVPLTIGGLTGTGYILDNDQPTITTLEPGEPGIDDDSVEEGNNLVFNVSLSEATITPATYSLSLGGGTASADDYTNLSFSNGVINNNDGTITVPAGVSGFSVTLPTVDDAIVELTEAVPLTIGGVTGNGQITDNDVFNKPIITIEDTDGALTGADNSVVEATGATIVGNISVTADAGISILTIAGQNITNASNVNVVIAGTEGTLTVTSYNAQTGAITYRFKEDGNSESHNLANNNILDQFTISVTDNSGETSTDILDIQIIDTEPSANNAANSLSEDDASVTGSVNITSGADADSVTAQNSVQGTHGTFSINADGQYTYLLNNSSAAVQNLNNGESLTDTFSYKVKDIDGDESTANVVITINGSNDGPSQLSARSASISDEGLNSAGLDDGIQDNTGNPTDTTNATSATGTLSFIDADETNADNLVITLSGPNGISSGGENIVWQWDANSSVLTGTSASSQETVATVTLADTTTNGASHSAQYTVNLLQPIDHIQGQQENIQDLNFGFSVSDGVNPTQNANFIVKVEDDMPLATDSSIDVTVPAVDTNLMITFDLSGSMKVPSGVGDLSRLELAKQSLQNLISKYDELGNVKVRIVTFNTDADKQGDVWVDADQAIEYLNALTQSDASGWTNYDAALNVAQDAYDDPGKLADAQNISYFLSDGIPTASDGNTSVLANTSTNPGGDKPDHGIQSTEETQWQSFLNTNDINSIALGMGSSVSQDKLNPIAYNGSDVNHGDSDSVIVSDLSQLTDVLENSLVITPVQGSIIGQGEGFGADNGYISEVTLRVSVVGEANPVTVIFSYNGTQITNNYSGSGSIAVINGSTLGANTANGSYLTIDLTNGAYGYQVKSVISNAYNEQINYKLTDNDGDSSSGSVVINVSPPVQADARSGINAVEPVEEIIQGTNLADNITTDATNDIIKGLEGNDILDGGAGDDILYGNLGEDQLTGGLGADTFVFESADKAASIETDIITDFNINEGDKLDLSDLLVDESSDNLSGYLSFTSESEGTLIHMKTAGEGTAEDHQVLLKGVDLITNPNGGVFDDAAILEALKTSIIIDH